ncbi:MAG: ferritin-like protein [Gammaproteobacteria bacterium]
MNLAERKSALLESLQAALELELATIPPYMMALLSIPSGQSRAAANLIRGVMMQEMLHMALVGNLISSLGGQSKLEKENIPTYPLRMKFKGRGFSDRDFDIHLAGLSREQLDVFLQVEMPSGLLPKMKPAFVPIEVPAPTIGDFYKGIEDELRFLCETYSVSEIFTGDSAKQIGPAFFWGAAGSAVVVTGLETALKALDLIIRQGEGGALATAAGETPYFADSLNRGHYFRFKEIAEGRLYSEADSPLGNPTGEPVEMDLSKCLVLLRNPRQEKYADGTLLAEMNASFNRHYSIMLRQIELAFNGNPLLLYEAIVNGMHGLAGIAIEMTNHRVTGSEAVMGCPSFEWVEPIA